MAGLGDLVRFVVLAVVHMLWEGAERLADRPHHVQYGPDMRHTRLELQDVLEHVVQLLDGVDEIRLTSDRIC